MPAAGLPVTTLLVGVSGGSDSLGLLMALRAAKTRLRRDDLRLVAATVDHRLRPGSADEAGRVGAICASLAIDHETLVWHDAASGPAVSERARNARYLLLQDLAARIEAQAIVVAHTFNDQAETVAMRLKRAPDGEGLAGMAPAVLIGGRHWLLRPFLSVTRQSIRDGLTAQAQGWIDDPTNEDRHYERVRMRQSLDDDAREALVSLGREQAGLRQALGEKAAVLAGEAVTVHGRGLAEIAVPVLRAADADVAGLVVRSLVAVCGGRVFAAGRDVRERLVGLALSAGDGRMTAGRCVIAKKSDRLFIVRETRDLPVLDLAPGESACWDARFVITNHTAGPVCVRPWAESDAPQAMPAVPAFVATLLQRSLPVLSAGDGGGEALQAGNIRVEPYLAPYENFLPLFDLALANAIAALFRRTSFAGAAMVKHAVEIAS
ncbi:tRNA lysidine(34) synthetase TilS [Martelella sp. HB161492]|uniref:tRNA lysidine(34) synthetase TilS n=1 Tax=Martelella sp. HB161492 TaxID=2720726 RepID=UPI0015907CFD|nr:tRNA lysidine(34) synthetase TilS [Martelella sp. HB161492]